MRDRGLMREFLRSPLRRDYERLVELRCKLALCDRPGRDQYLRAQELVGVLGEWLHKERPGILAIWEHSRDRKEGLEGELKRLYCDQQGNGDVCVLYKEALDRVTDNYLVSLSGLLSDCFRQIFQDGDRRIELVTVDYRGKKLVRIRVMRRVGDREFEEALEANGNGARLVVGFLVNIYFLVVSGLPRILFLDEILSALSPECVERFMGVCVEFRDKLDFSFVIISHTADVVRRFADREYTIRDGIYVEVGGGS